MARKGPSLAAQLIALDYADEAARTVRHVDQRPTLAMPPSPHDHQDDHDPPPEECQSTHRSCIPQQRTFAAREAHPRPQSPEQRAAGLVDGLSPHHHQDDHDPPPEECQPTILSCTPQHRPRTFAACEAEPGPEGPKRRAGGLRRRPGLGGKPDAVEFARRGAGLCVTNEGHVPGKVCAGERGLVSVR